MFTSDTSCHVTTIFKLNPCEIHTTICIKINTESHTLSNLSFICYDVASFRKPNSFNRQQTGHSADSALSARTGSRVGRHMERMFGGRKSKKDKKTSKQQQQQQPLPTEATHETRQ